MAGEKQEEEAAALAAEAQRNEKKRLPAGLPHKLFICSFPDCDATYNKGWKLDAHLCRHTGEVRDPTGGLPRVQLEDPCCRAHVVGARSKGGDAPPGLAFVGDPSCTGSGARLGGSALDEALGWPASFC